MIELVTLASLKKKLAWDLIPHPDVVDTLPILDVLPGSEEGEEKEHRASHIRMAGAEPIEDFSMSLGAMSGEIVARCILESQGLEQDDEVAAAYAQIGAVISHAVLANLIDLNLVHLGGHP